MINIFYHLYHLEEKKKNESNKGNLLTETKTETKESSNEETQSISITETQINTNMLSDKIDGTKLSCDQTASIINNEKFEDIPKASLDSGDGVKENLDKIDIANQNTENSVKPSTVLENISIIEELSDKGTKCGNIDATDVSKTFDSIFEHENKDTNRDFIERESVLAANQTIDILDKNSHLENPEEVVLNALDIQKSNIIVANDKTIDESLNLLNNHSSNINEDPLDDHLEMNTKETDNKSSNPTTDSIVIPDMGLKDHGLSNNKSEEEVFSLDSKSEKRKVNIYSEDTVADDIPNKKMCLENSENSKTCNLDADIKEEKTKNPNDENDTMDANTENFICEKEREPCADIQVPNEDSVEKMQERELDKMIELSNCIPKNSSDSLPMKELKTIPLETNDVDDIMTQNDPNTKCENIMDTPNSDEDLSKMQSEGNQNIFCSEYSIYNIPLSF